MDHLLKKKIWIRNWYTSLLKTCKLSNLLASFTMLFTNVSLWKDVKMKSLKNINDLCRRVNLFLTKRWIYKSSFSVSVFKRQLYLPYSRVGSALLLTRWVNSSYRNHQTKKAVVVMMSSILSRRKHRTTALQEWLKARTRWTSAS